ncbi:heparinase II/III family protein [Paenibacillus sp. MER 99-2]|uniref:heparinase II/III family protein n=1 Tax=Paenibacillus sp. MER 99-2 TaxID=2939572 RepID=UPI00203F1B9D|nr:heparinase II/III family protein [Paenibacillus sp. MER 99-2]MCM3174817.1 heparinase II/III-family protein [Paenibacillus sp. MER 99-2]
MTVHPGLNWTTKQIAEALEQGTSKALESVSEWKGRIANTRNDQEYNDFWKDIETYALRASCEPMPELSFTLLRQFRDAGERKAYEAAYFERRGRIVALGVLTASATSKNSTYVSLLEDLIWSVCNEHTWCLSAHIPPGEEANAYTWIDLFAAETAQMLAEIIVMLGGIIDERVERRVRSEMERRIFAPLYREDRTYGWERAEHNWSAVCSGGCGVAALLLLEDQSLRVKAVEHTLQAMDAFLHGYGEDGGCAEGIGYWVYGFGFYTYYAEMLRTFSAGTLDMLSESKTRAIALFPQHIHLSAGTFVNYSDSHEREVIPSGLLSRLAKRAQGEVNWRLSIPLVTDDPCRRWAHVARNLLWTDRAVLDDHREQAGQPPSQTFIVLEDLSWIMGKAQLMHDEEMAGIEVAFSVKGGHNDEPHNHNDLGHFILHAAGDNILCDPGAGAYSQAYFSPGRESILQIGSQGHNVPIIEGMVQQSGREAEAKMLEMKHTSLHSAAITFDLTSAYRKAPTLDRYTRHLNWSCPPAAQEAELWVEDHFTWKSAYDSDCIDMSIDDVARVGEMKLGAETRPNGETNGFSSPIENVDTNPSMKSSTGISTNASTGTNVSACVSAYKNVIQRLVSHVEPVIHDGVVQWKTDKVVVSMTYESEHSSDRWVARLEVVDTVDHDHLPLRLYVTELVLERTPNQGMETTAPSVQETWCRMKFITRPSV